MFEELNWHGFDFFEVAPDYTNRAQSVQTSMIRIETVKNLSVHANPHMRGDVPGLYVEKNEKEA